MPRILSRNVPPVDDVSNSSRVSRQAGRLPTLPGDVRGHGFVDAGRTHEQGASFYGVRMRCSIRLPSSNSPPARPSPTDIRVRTAVLLVVGAESRPISPAGEFRALSAACGDGGVGNRAVGFLPAATGFQGFSGLIGGENPHGRKDAAFSFASVHVPRPKSTSTNLENPNTCRSGGRFCRSIMAVSMGYRCLAAGADCLGPNGFLPHDRLP